MLTLLALTISDAVALSVTVIASFHYCGGNTNVGKIGLAIRGAGEYRYTVCGLGGYTGMVKNRRTNTIWKRQKTAEKKGKKLIAKCRCDVLHSIGWKGEGNTIVPWSTPSK